MVPGNDRKSARGKKERSRLTFLQTRKFESPDKAELLSEFFSLSVHWRGAKEAEECGMWHKKRGAQWERWLLDSQW